MTKLQNIEGIGPAYSRRLKEAGVETAEQLLEKGRTPAAREALAEASNISIKYITRWVQNADLLRIEGVGKNLADLLEESGIESVQALARQSAPSLLATLTQTNESNEIVQSLPTEAEVAAWIEHARSLPPLLSEADEPEAEEAAPSPAPDLILETLNMEAKGIVNHDMGLLEYIHAETAVHTDRGTGHTWHGWSEIRHRYEYIFSLGWHSLEFIQPEIDVEGDTASVRTNGIVVNGTPRQDVTVYRFGKQGDRWLITALEFNSVM